MQISTEPQFNVEFFQKLHNNRRSWSPTLGTPSDIVKGAEPTMGRLLALHVLEIPVKDLIQDALDNSKIPQEVVEVLVQNQADEDKHDQVLSHAMKTQGLTSDKMFEEAKQLRDQWIDLDEHPLLKVSVMERSLFFVYLPMYRFLSRRGGTLQVAQRDITTDEILHVAVHTEYCRTLGLEVNEKLNQLRRDTLEWSLQDFVDVKAGPKYGNVDTWRKSSESLFASGKAELLKETRKPVMTALFETQEKNRAQYS